MKFFLSNSLPSSNFLIVIQRKVMILVIRQFRVVFGSLKESISRTMLYYTIPSL